MTKRKFPNDKSFIYNLPKHEIGKWLNTWFKQEEFINTHKQRFEIDAYWTVKLVDKETEKHLYHRKYNPVSLKINGTSMCARIHSIDDSSYGIWFENVDNLQDIRSKIMKYLDGLKIINGKEFLEVCVSLGANPESIDYN